MEATRTAKLLSHLPEYTYLKFLTCYYLPPVCLSLPDSWKAVDTRDLWALWDPCLQHTCLRHRSTVRSQHTLDVQERPLTALEEVHHCCSLSLLLINTYSSNTISVSDSSVTGGHVYVFSIFYQIWAKTIRYWWGKHELTLMRDYLVKSVIDKQTKASQNNIISSDVL